MVFNVWTQNQEVFRALVEYLSLEIHISFFLIEFQIFIN